MTQCPGSDTHPTVWELLVWKRPFLEFSLTMQQPQFGAFFRDLQVSTFSNIWPLVQEKTKWTSMFKAEIPEIRMAFRWVHPWGAGGHGWD